MSIGTLSRDDLDLTDLFCGFGGSSHGATKVPGVTVRMAANHWRLAVDTHNENHPEADHDCADLSQVDPRRYPRTRILWASPSCTNHSQAKGVKRDNQPDLFGEFIPNEAAERSRATMWDVPRFTEVHRYDAVIVENVVEAAVWIMWPAWLMAMELLGYEFQTVYLSSMHAQALGAPAPQSRDRLYVIFTKKGARKPNLSKWTRPQAWCPGCEQVVRAVQDFKNGTRWGRYRAQYLYKCPTVACRGRVVEPGFLPASTAIDWSISGQRIGDRTKPLADKTRTRIAGGLKKYAGQPMHIEAAGNTYERPGSGYVRAWPVSEELKTLHTTATKALVVPVEGRQGLEARHASEPLRTQTARHQDAVVVPPFIAELRGGGSTHSPVSDVMATVTASGNHHALVQPPMLVPTGGTWRDDARSVGEPMAARTTRDNDAVVVPAHTALVMRNNTARGDQGQMSTPVNEALRTLTTTGAQSLVQWDAVYSYDTGALRTPADVLPAQTTVAGDALLSGLGVPDVDDCLLRMLTPDEIQAGMGFDPDYITNRGNKRERVRGLGNAVTPSAARDLVAAVVEALTGEDIARLN